MTVENPGQDPASDAKHPGAPRWVKVLVGIVLVLAVALAIGKIAGVEHGPGQHSGSGSGEQTTHTAPAGGHTPPPGGHP